MRSVLLYNPYAGTKRNQRLALMQQIADVLRDAGHTVDVVETVAKGSGGLQAADAIRNGAETVFACGGDGTVHDVLQGVIGTHAALGVVPMGSANALARELALPMDPIAAVRKQLTYAPRCIPAGRITMAEQVRYFSVMAGAGPDGALVYRMVTDDKRHLGRIAYYARAGALFLRRRFPHFRVAYRDVRDGGWLQMDAVSVMAVRIRDLGGIFSRLSRGGQVDASSLHLVLVRPPGWLSLPLWFAMSWIGLHRWNPLLKVVDATEFQCEGSADVQADGEWLGRGAMQVQIVPNALHLLMPAS